MKKLDALTQSILAAVMISIAVFLVFWIWAFSDYANLQAFVKDQQFPLLALVVALGAYTSSVEQKLRETATQRKKLSLPATDLEEDLKRLYVVDGLLMLTGVTVMFRIIWWIHSPKDVSPSPLIDCLMLGMLAVSILYFAWLHILQWKK
ncbi:MAG: hypothetical protein Q8L74_04545 [Nitrospirota bacterium]|nr:hypothetical protein [Nitrospirota bacterium]MDP2381203.1 hypothetical protein [Nitrospirota bacterium]